MNVREYSLPITTYVDFNVDFDRIYSEIKRKYPDLGHDDIYNQFGDNIEKYICEFGGVTDEQKKMIEEASGPDYDCLLDDIWSDFSDYLNEKDV